MTSLQVEALAIAYHDEAIDTLAAARSAKPKARRKAAAGAARLLGWAAQAGATDGSPERTRRRFRAEAIAAAGVDDETPSAEREAFLRLLDREIAVGVGMALDAHESPELAGIDYSRVERHRLDAHERRMGRELAEQDLRDGAGEAAEVYVDVAKLLEGDLTATTPNAGGIRADGERMLYRGKVNGLVGEGEVAKSIAAACMVADELNRGGSALWGDLDHNGPEATVTRLVDAGIEPKVLRDPSRFRLVVPESRAGLMAAVEDAADWSPTMAVLDSVGEIVPMFGGDSNNADDYTRVHREVFARLADTGAAVLVIDHLAKTALSTGYASGTGAKKRAMDGAYYGVKLVEAFRPGVGGASALTILKDRHGGVRAKTPTDTAAVFRLDSRGDTWTWEFYPGRSDDERSADGLEGDVATVLALPVFPTSRTALQGALRATNGKGWNNERARIALAEATQRRTTTFPIDPRTTDK